MAEEGGIKHVSKLMCSICLDTFTDPKLLPCFHTFCLKCLEDYATRTQKNNQLSCPLCRVNIEIPVGGVRGFQSNFYIEGDQMPIVCDVCGHGTNANNRCLDCEENFCELCSNAHMKMKITRKHRLLELSETRMNVLGKIKSKSFCAKHTGEEIKMLCKECDTLLCIVCKLTEHENHSSVDIAMKAELTRKRLSSLLANARERVEKINNRVNSMDKNKEHLQRMFEYDVDALSRQIEEKVYEIRSEGQRVRQTLKDVCDEDLQKIEKTKSKMKAKVKSCDFVIKTSSHLLEVGCDADILNSCSDLMAKVTDVCNAPVLLTSGCRYTSLRYSFGNLSPKFYMYKSRETFHKVQLINTLMHGESVYSISNNCRCISVDNQKAIVSFLDSLSLHKYTLPDPEKGVDIVREHGKCAGITSDGNGNTFFTTLSDKAIRKLTHPEGTASKIQTTSMYPHGLAFRPRNLSHHVDELLVCIVDDSDPVSQKSVKGYVKAVPVDGEGGYNIIAEHCPAPTSIAISKVSGMICLGYPAARKVALLTSDGKLTSEFQGSYEAGIPEAFCPMSVCFDKLNGVIIADCGNDAVIKINESGTFLQILTKECRPLAVAMEEGNVLWVGDAINAITRYQLARVDAV